MERYGRRAPAGVRPLLVAGLFACGCAASWLLAELALRAHYALTYAPTLEDVAAQRMPPSRGSAVSLGRMLRVSPYDGIVFELIPDLDVVFMGSRVRTNPQGWRDQPFELAKPPETLRIIGIGDSVMFGWGVDERQRYADRLEEDLNLHYPDRRWEVMTFAVPGYNLVMELEVLRRYALAYEPDLILYGFVANDACLPNFVSTRLPVLSTTSFVARYVRGLAENPLPLVARSEILGPEMEEVRPWARYCEPSSIPPAYRDLVGWERFQGALEELIRIGAERGIPVVFLSHFAGGDMPALEGLDDLILVAVRLGQAERLGGARGAEGERGRHVIGRGDPHPSAAGHALIAHEIFRTLQAQGTWARLAGRPQR